MSVLIYFVCLYIFMVVIWFQIWSCGGSDVEYIVGAYSYLLFIVVVFNTKGTFHGNGYQPGFIFQTLIKIITFDL